MTMYLQDFPDWEYAYLRRVGPYGEGNREIMERLKAWARARHLLKEDSVILGIPRDDPRLTLPENCRYDCCIVLPGTLAPGEKGVERGRIAGGRYAVFELEHTAKALQEGWRSIFPELTRQNHVPDESRPIIERYTPAKVRDHLCEICVPIAWT